MPVGLRMVVLLAAALALAGCGMFAESWEWKQKLTVEVMTPDGIRSGSAVSYVRWQEPDPFGNYGTRFRGEATVVDLGQGRFLFALIGEPTKQIAAYTLHGPLGEDRGNYEELFPKIMAFRGSRDVPRDRYPLLVTFADLGDPKTVREVDPDNLAATFGPGVSLRRIALEITDEEVTEGKVDMLLQWLNDYYDKHLDGQRFETASAQNRFANSLGAGNFDTVR